MHCTDRDVFRDSSLYIQGRQEGINPYMSRDLVVNGLGYFEKQDKLYIVVNFSCGVPLYPSLSVCLFVCLSICLFSRFGLFLSVIFVVIILQQVEVRVRNASFWIWTLCHIKCYVP